MLHPQSNEPSEPRLNDQTASDPAPQPFVGPPNKHELAVMIWIAVFPTLTALNLAIGPWIAHLNPVLRTFALATIAVPVVIYGLMPRLHALRARLLIRRAA